MRLLNGHVDPGSRSGYGPSRAAAYHCPVASFPSFGAHGRRRFFCLTFCLIFFPKSEIRAIVFKDLPLIPSVGRAPPVWSPLGGTKIGNSMIGVYTIFSSKLLMFVCAAADRVALSRPGDGGAWSPPQSQVILPPGRKLPKKLPRRRSEETAEPIVDLLNRGVSAAGIAAQEGLGAKRSRPEMAPQRIEKIESAPGNGSVSEALKPQDVVHGRAADRARLRLTSRGKVAERIWVWIPCKQLKLRRFTAKASGNNSHLESCRKRRLMP